jgi:hypothetical protein
MSCQAVRATPWAHDDTATRHRLPAAVLLRARTGDELAL